MEVKLVVVSGEAQAAEYVLNLPAIIGRSRTADIKLGHPLVSRKHCELYEADGQLAVRDLGSLNGTFVGETRISDATFLPPGAAVTIGAVTFQAVYGDMDDQAADADTSELPDFMAAPAAAAVAAPMEQTMEMSEIEPAVEESAEIAVEEEADEAAPKSESAGVNRDEGFDFGWLDESAEGGESPVTEPVAPLDESAEIEVEAEVEPEVEAAVEEEELEFPDLPVAEEEPAEVEAEAEAEVEAEANGQADSADEFAPPEEEPAASGDDEDLSDFFASLK